MNWLSDTPYRLGSRGCKKLDRHLPSKQRSWGSILVLWLQSQPRQNLDPLTWSSDGAGPAKGRERQAVEGEPQTDTAAVKPRTYQRRPPASGHVQDPETARAARRDGKAVKGMSVSPSGADALPGRRAEPAA